MSTLLVERLAQEANSDDPFAGLDENCYVDRAQDLDFAHTSWYKFKEDLTNVCTNLFPRPIPEHARIHVVLLNWLEDDLGTIDELIKLETWFKDCFDCSTEVWRMPSSHQAEWELGLKLSIVTGQYRGEDDLVVVYYGGHGEEDPNHQSIWRANLERTSPKLNWSSLQPTLLRAPCDVLILLDCCYAGAAARHNVLGTNELLAACVREQGTPGVCPTSFTEMVMRKIHSFGRQPFTIADLYLRLLKDRKRLKSTPQHHCFSSRDGRKLTLKPRQIAMTDGDQGPRMDASVSPSTSTSRSSNSPSLAQSSSSMISPSLEYPRILLAISLQSDAVIPDIESCTRWLAVEAPVEILKVDVRIESAYDANSTLIFVSMPVEVWTYLPKVSAYRFIDFIRSDNLLPQATSEQWDNEILAGSVTTTSVSALVKGKYLPVVERQERLFPYIYVKEDPGIVTAQYTQSLYDVCHLHSVRDIRVLILRPGNPEDPIVCTLLVWSMMDIMSGNNTVSYEALSHCWGPAGLMREIKVYTSETKFSTYLKIGPELYAALQRLRDVHSQRHLWVDAICINLENMNEQNSQVALMPSILYHASNVCIWLGPGSYDSDLAMDFIVRLANLEDFERIVKEEYAREDFTALNSLMMREWFCSCWSLQVLALARRATLYCGHAQIDRLDFEAALSLLEAAAIDSKLRQSRLYDFAPTFLNDMEFRPAARLLGVTSDFRRTENGHIWGRYLSLEDLVCKVSHFRTTKPHDVIYSVLALANNVIPMPVELDKPRIERSVPTEMQKELFLVDYEKPFIDVCKEFLTHTIKAKQSLDIICRPWVPVTSIEDQGKPSWLLTTEQASYRLRPDGKFARAHADPLVGPAGLGKRNYSASGQSKVVPAWPLFGTGAKERFMYVEGFVVDTVSVKMEYAPDGIIPVHEWLKAVDWSDKSALPPPPFWRTLCADRGPNGSNPPTFYPRACKSALKQGIKHGQYSMMIFHSGKSTVVTGFLKRVQEVILMRSLIKTKGGIRENDLPRLGLAPKLTQKRDLICILYGCSVPVVLRKHHAGKPDEHYTFIGECYVHGIMEGEAFDLIKRRNRSETIPKQTFELR